MNYQGGERKTFYGTFPFEAHGVTFGNSGQWMTTDQLGPLVEGRDEASRAARGPARPAAEIREAFLRATSATSGWAASAARLPYFFPAVLAAAGLPGARPARPRGLAGAWRRWPSRASSTSG